MRPRTTTVGSRSVWLRGASGVSIVKAANFTDRDDVALAGRHDLTGNRSILVQCQVRPGSFVVRAVARHQLPHARFVERDHMIETLAPRPQIAPRRDSARVRAAP